MKAVALTRYLPIDHPEALLDVELPDPVATGHDLLVEVRAVSVNPVDTKVRSPKDQVESKPRVLGWDAAGIVKAVGDQVTLYRPGDEVYYAGSVTRPGCDSELHLVDERIVGTKPRTLDFAQAAALPLTTLTAWEALFDRLGVSPTGTDAGKTVLVIGGAGGVGSIATQLAKRVADLTVIATASRPESAAWVRERGADHVIDYTRPLAEELKRIGVPEVNHVLCFQKVDPYFAALPEIMAAQGKLCMIVETSTPLPIGNLMRKSITIAWELMFTRAIFGTPDMARQHEILEQTASLIDRGVLATTLGEHYGTITAANMKRAHATVERGHAVGKIVLSGF